MKVLTILAAVLAGVMAPPVSGGTLIYKDDSGVPMVVTGVTIESISAATIGVKSGKKLLKFGRNNVLKYFSRDLNITGTYTDKTTAEYETTIREIILPQTGASKSGGKKSKKSQANEAKVRYSLHFDGDNRNIREPIIFLLVLTEDGRIFSYASPDTVQLKGKKTDEGQLLEQILSADRKVIDASILSKDKREKSLSDSVATFKLEGIGDKRILAALVLIGGKSGIIEQKEKQLIGADVDNWWWLDGGK